LKSLKNKKDSFFFRLLFHFEPTGSHFFLTPLVAPFSVLEALLSVLCRSLEKAVPSFGSGLSEPSFIETQPNWIDESGSLFPVGLAKSKSLYFSRVRPSLGNGAYSSNLRFL